MKGTAGSVLGILSIRREKMADWSRRVRLEGADSFTIDDADIWRRELICAWFALPGEGLTREEALEGKRFLTEWIHDLRGFSMRDHPFVKRPPSIGGRIW